MKARSLFVIFAAGSAALVGPSRTRAADWPQFNLDSRHSGTNLQETTINGGNVATLHVRYHIALPAVADGAPALLQGVTTPQGIVDLLFFDTKDGRILAVDAATGAIVWSRQPATGPGWTASSPAIDPNRQYVYAYALDGKVHKYQVGDGTEITTGGWPEVATLKPDLEQGSSNLTAATVGQGGSFLYVASSGYPSSTGDFQGHVTAISLDTGLQTVFNAACSEQHAHLVTGGTPDCAATGSGIWARAGVVYDSDNDKLFFVTGVGPYSANTGGTNWGESIVATRTDASTGDNGWPRDAYTPNDYQQLQAASSALGSTAPAILPVPATSKYAHLGVQGAVEAEFHLVNLDDLSLQGGPGHLGGEVEPTAVPQGGGVLTQPAVWLNPQNGTSWFFTANDNGISAMQLWVDAAGNPTIFPQWSKSGNGGTSPVVANGIVYYAGSTGVRALDPMSGNVLWSDSSLGPIHWESPIVVNGRLYVADENAVLWVYEPTPPPLSLYTLTPCRVVDTRWSDGPNGGPVLQGGTPRTFAIAGQCGVPADAQAVSANITVVSPSGPGSAQVAPANVVTGTPIVAFNAGQTRANNAVVSLTGNPLGSASATAQLQGTVHLVIDVNGYFK